MTIKEIEARSGMTRANVRFYESEGLLRPERRENGYRAYSEDDLATLLRIRLLRSLRVPLDDIRALQEGGMELSDALREQLDALAAEQKTLKRSQTVCREMLDDGAEYASLDARRYLDALSREAPAAVPEGDAIPKLRAPWRRYFARVLDAALCGVLWVALLALVFRVNIARLPNAARTLLSFAEALTLLFLEPLFLSCFGTTPGKWLFGLHVTDNNGRKLFYSEAFARTFSVWGTGYGYSIPIYNLYRLYKSCRACNAGETLAWEYDSVETLRDDNTWRWAAYLAAYAAAIGLGVTAILAAELPKYRGDITAAEFCDNYNRIVRYYEPDATDLLDESGHWVDAAREGTVVIHVFGDVPRPELVFTEEDGCLTGVSFEQSLADKNFPPSYSSMRRYMVIAFAGAQKGAGLYMSEARKAADRIARLPYTDLDDAVCGVRVVSDFDYAGYWGDGSGGYLLAEDGSPTTYAIHFSMSK